jgi:carbamoyl-phosphate synthase/aspartate carbamoyltransferase/dihydroorotase
LITVDRLRKDVLHKLFNLAHDLRILVLTDKDLTSLLRGKVIAEMFWEPSTRTQCSFTAAAQRLGASVIYMDQQHSSVKKGETLEDSVRMMSGYSDLVVIRHPEPGAAEKAAKVSNVPLVNAGIFVFKFKKSFIQNVFFEQMFNNFNKYPLKIN